jgi:phenylacetate-coenzyme A ligase PaaK-like adenylate-forming protein
MERNLVNPFIHRRTMLEPFWLGPQESGPVDYDRYLAEITALSPEVLSMYPLYGFLLAKHIRRTGQEPPAVSDLIDFSGGLVTPRMRTLIADVFGVPTAQSCGGCEFARYAASCRSSPDYMHILEEYCYVETVRPDGELCASGELGNVVVTSLHSRAMPIIRLEPGDVARIIDDPCACGRRSRRIQHGGRIQALIRSTDKRWVTAAEVWNKLLFVPGIELFQLVQRSPQRFHLRIVPEPDRALDQDILQHELQELLGKRARVEQEIVGGICPERSGKLQLVKSTTYQDFRPKQVRTQQVPVN